MNKKWLQDKNNWRKKVEEYKVELALQIIQIKIAEFIKNYKGKDKKEFIETVRKLKRERTEIYRLNKEIIDKTYNVYLKEIS